MHTERRIHLERQEEAAKGKVVPMACQLNTRLGCWQSELSMLKGRASMSIAKSRLPSGCAQMGCWQSNLHASIFLPSLICTSDMVYGKASTMEDRWM